MSYETIRFDVGDDGVARIVLNRPDKANSFSLQLVTELNQAASICDCDPKIRAVVLTGTGRFFSAGGDLAEFSSAGDRMDQQLQATTLQLHAAAARFHRMNAPLIIALNGTAAGGGFSLAISGDIVIAAETAKLTMGYGKVGLSPDGTSTYFLPRLVGLRRAQELIFTHRVLTAEEAREWGLVTKVVPADQLFAEVDALAKELAAGATRAYGAAKQLLTSSFVNGVETQSELESRAIAGLTRSRDGKEGITAFLEKRPPKFEGR